MPKRQGFSSTGGESNKKQAAKMAAQSESVTVAATTTTARSAESFRSDGKFRFSETLEQEIITTSIKKRHSAESLTSPPALVE
jgi:hypothetical protein